MKALIVDDDPKLRGFLKQGLTESGIECEDRADAESALTALVERPHEFDLVLLDVMLPGRSGWSLLEELRERGLGTPVIFLTARQAVEERVKGLHLGADDYIIKPFELSELLARIDAVMRRREATDRVRIGDIAIDPIGRWIEHGNERIEMSPREFDLLRTLATRPGRTFTRTELLERVWGIEFDPGTNVVDVQIARLRRRLGGVRRPRIETVIGQGYRLNVEEDR